MTKLIQRFSLFVVSITFFAFAYGYYFPSRFYVECDGNKWISVENRITQETKNAEHEGQLGITVREYWYGLGHSIDWFELKNCRSGGEIIECDEIKNKNTHSITFNHLSGNFEEIQTEILQNETRTEITSGKDCKKKKSVLGQ